jgi:pyridoxal phosphate enzyme (YggS family)
MSFNITDYNEIINFIKENSIKKVKIIAISKNFPVLSVNLAISSGIKIFGENRVQEAEKKFSTIKESNPDIELHLTGPLQTNKVKQALNIFDVFQTLDREKLVLEFYKHKSISMSKFFFIQINTGAEKNKSGILPADADKFIEYCKLDLKMPVIGLMCIPPQNENPSEHFKRLSHIALKNNLENLSMGMSGDYKEGVLGGATHIRVGTKLFGTRTQC